MNNKKHKNMEQKTLEELIAIISDRESNQEDVDDAILELRTRLKVLTSGGDRPNKPPINP